MKQARPARLAADRDAAGMDQRGGFHTRFLRQGAEGGVERRVRPLAEAGVTAVQFLQQLPALWRAAERFHDNFAVGREIITEEIGRPLRQLAEQLHLFPDKPFPDEIYPDFLSF